MAQRRGQVVSQRSARWCVSDRPSKTLSWRRAVYNSCCKTQPRSTSSKSNAVTSSNFTVRSSPHQAPVVRKTACTLSPEREMTHSFCH
ncbi:hypothetical protein chiPu_0000888 [Chiloscyllium punctatum]|uniref:Uncharacterized protein n=1 Tax=Chiloscyllium punctatum TaxID=137246 RepID=A0A401RWH1_CHIPU|nr:hypothetical protein [Chiloscyllium punctatum]